MTQKITLFQAPAINAEEMVTKSGILTSAEFDQNLIALYNAGIKSVERSNDDLVLVRKDGEKIVGKDLLKPENSIKEITFDTTTCNLVVTYVNGESDNVRNLRDFLLQCQSISTDSTIVGDGSPIRPLSIADNYRTGQYMPVDGIVKCAEGSCDCNANDCKCLSQLPVNPAVGERFVTKEKINLYGKLYNFHGVKHIAKALCTNYHYHTEDACKGWHIPTIEDWNDLLNSIEPNPQDRDHAENCSYCGDRGMWAGMLLKSGIPFIEGGWQEFNPTTDKHCDCADHSQMCGKPQCCGTTHECTHNVLTDNGNCNCHTTNPCSCEPAGVCSICNGNKPCCCCPPNAMDVFGFNALPAGYGVHSEQLAGEGVLTYFWTSTFRDGQVFVKRLCYDSNKVHSAMLNECEYASLRLVKDYDPKTYREFETILGKTYRCVLMPSASGKKVWLGSNFDGGCECCSKDCIHKSSLTPNVLDKVNSPAKYYINEWNGFGWVKNELNEGDTFVVKGVDMRELRVKKTVTSNSYSTVINYELVNPFNDTIKETTSNILSSIADNETININGLGSLSVKIDESDENKDKNMIQVSENGLLVDDSRITTLETRAAELEETLNNVGTYLKTLLEQLKQGGFRIDISKQ